MNRRPDTDDAGRIALSALEHYAYCPRQAALIHVEGVFSDDANTVRGSLAHERVDKPGIRASATKGTRQHYAVPVFSAEIGIYGRCDVVEIGHGTAIPVEHKIGAYHPDGPADIQVAAQVLCLREMLNLDISHGEVFAHLDRRRHKVVVTAALEAAVRRTVQAMREVLTAPVLPAPLADSRCRRCSLLDDCLPHALVKPADDLFTPRPLGQWDA